MSGVFGLLFGFAAGLIGVGGGEFRIPVLIYVANLPILIAVTVNLVIGLLSVSISFLRRFQLGLFSQESLWIAVVMSFGSIIGAYMGATLTGKLPVKTLKKLLTTFLIVVGFRIISEPLWGWSISKISLSEPILSILAIIFGLMVGLISGIFGVAGGEFRIPILMFLFGMDIKIAGTTSLLISIPTISSGLIKHQRMGHMNSYGVIVAASMGVATIIGSFIGASMVTEFSEGALKIILGLILILATVRMITKP
ncbi:MAG: sulfite exporter TauE/SafE family protein [archaeon GBS-70-058]|nr:sulfite exporter TauE/SafE family protein [Candidatus Culexarchaeum nevadense]